MPASDALTSRAPESPRFNVQKSASSNLFDVAAINTSAGSNPAIDSKRNFWLGSVRKDNLIEFMKEMLHHSFVLNSQDSYMGTMKYFEELVQECVQVRSQLK